MVITRGLAWFGILAIVILSVVPADVRPTTGAAPGFEHLAAFGLVAGVFAIGYRLSLGRLLLMAFLYCGAVELLQVPLPTRHARLIDFVIDVGSAWAAMSLVDVSDKLSVAYRVRRQRRKRTP
jgi:predicted branched-subunit amino acid permease